MKRYDTVIRVRAVVQIILIQPNKTETKQLLYTKRMHSDLLGGGGGPDDDCKFNKINVMASSSLVRGERLLTDALLNHTISFRGVIGARPRF